MQERVLPRMLVYVLATLAWGATTYADVVGPPPPSCPAGSQGESCHGGPYCRPWTCTSDADCPGSRACRSLPLCVTNLECGVWEPYSVVAVDSACPGGSECRRGVCRSFKVCVERQDNRSDASSGEDSNRASNDPAGGSREPGLHAGVGTRTLLIVTGLLGVVLWLGHRSRLGR